MWDHIKTRCDAECRNEFNLRYGVGVVNGDDIVGVVNGDGIVGVGGSGVFEGTNEVGVKVTLILGVLNVGLGVR